MCCANPELWRTKLITSGAEADLCHAILRSSASCDSSSMACCIVVATAQPTTTRFSQSPEFDLCNTAASDGSWGVVKVLGLVGSHANSSGGSNVYAIGGFQSNETDGCSDDYADPGPGCSIRLYSAVWASDDSGATWRCKPAPAEVARISSALVVYDLLSESVRNGEIVDPGRCRLVCVAGGLQDTDGWAASTGVGCGPDDGDTWVSQEELPFAVIDAMLIQVGRGSLMLLGGHRPGAVNDSAASVGYGDSTCQACSACGPGLEVEIACNTTQNTVCKVSPAGQPAVILP